MDLFAELSCELSSKQTSLLWLSVTKSAKQDITNSAKQDTNNLHCKLALVSKSMVQQTARFYNWMVTNQFENCASCTLAKSRQKNMNKEKNQALLQNTRKKALHGH